MVDELILKAAGANYKKSTTTLADVDEVVARETSEIIPLPENPSGSNSTSVAGTSFVGASYSLRKRVQFDRIIVRVTTVGGAATGKFLIYQAPNGLSGVASLKATVSAFSVAIGSNILTPSEGIVSLSEGLFYLLWGRDSGVGTNFTQRTYINNANDLLNQNVDADTHPTVFTTSISTALTPATFNPLENPAGDPSGSTSDLAAILRLKKV